MAKIKLVFEFCSLEKSRGALNLMSRAELIHIKCERVRERDRKRKRERQRKRKRERERKRKRERQTEKKSERDRGKEKERDRGKERERDRGKERERERERDNFAAKIGSYPGKAPFRNLAFYKHS